MQRPRHAALRQGRSRRGRDPRGLWADTRRRLLRHGRNRSDRRPELRPWLHGQYRSLRAAGMKHDARVPWSERMAASGEGVASGEWREKGGQWPVKLNSGRTMPALYWVTWILRSGNSP